MLDAASRLIAEGDFLVHQIFHIVAVLVRHTKVDWVIVLTVFESAYFLTEKCSTHRITNLCRAQAQRTRLNTVYFDRHFRLTRFNIELQLFDTSDTFRVNERTNLIGRLDQFKVVVPCDFNVYWRPCWRPIAVFGYTHDHTRVVAQRSTNLIEYVCTVHAVAFCI